MLTEKAFKDYGWCPTLFRETEGNPKRFKEDRKWTDTTIEEIHAALTTGAPTKRAIPSKLTMGYRADPYQGDFWVVLEAGPQDTQVLLAFQEARLTKDMDSPWRVEVLRKQKKQPRGEDSQRVEQMLHYLLYRDFRKHFPRQDLQVITRYDSPMGAKMVTANVTEDQIQEAHCFVEEIRKAQEGESQLMANSDNCGVCWWRDRCPVGTSAQARTPSGSTNGLPTRSLL